MPHHKPVDPAGGAGQNRGMAINRRAFLCQSAATAAALISSAAVRGDDAQPLPIIDTHQHLWDLDRFRLSWLDKAGPLLKRNYLAPDDLKAVEGLNVRQAVYMEVAVPPEQQPAHAWHAFPRPCDGHCVGEVLRRLRDSG